MNEIELLIRSYLSKANTQAAGMSDATLNAFAERCRAALDRRFNEAPRDGFTLRMSNVGRPLCQLQMQKAGAPEEPAEYNHSFKMLLGDLVEAALMAIMESAGVNIVSEQEQVSLPIADTEINGTLDVTIKTDKERLYDIKSASPFAFETKFDISERGGFNKILDDDNFGYIGQGFGYAKARGTPFGGWIVVNKATGEVVVCEAPDDPQVADAALSKIEQTVRAINENKPFERCFSDEPETFRKVPTGNRILASECQWCPFKKACWPDVKYLPQPASKAINPPFKWYTEYNG